MKHLLLAAAAILVIPVAALAASGDTVTTETSMRLLSVEAISQTGVLLTFSNDIALATADAPMAFTIRDGSGAMLGLSRIVIEGKIATLTTVVQEEGKVYEVTVSGVVRGKGTGSATIALDSAQGPMLFQGASGSLTPAVPAAPQPQAKGAITNLSLSAKAGDKGTYAVQASWAAPKEEVSGYEIAQSIDGGKSFGQSMKVDAQTRGVSVSSVPSGEFAVAVRYIRPDGSASQGVSAKIVLPRAGSTVTPVQVSPTASVTPSHTSQNSLPSSGMGTSVLVSIFGGVAAYHWVKKRRQLMSVPA